MENIKSKKIFASLLKILAAVFVALFAVAIPLGCDGADPGKTNTKDYTEYVVPDTPVPTGGARTIFHYYRPDGKYDKWNVYHWATGVNGVNAPIVGYQTIGGQKWAVMVVETAVVKASDDGYMGYIIRKGNTWTKDVEDDRWIPESAIVNGVANIYVISQDANTYCSEQEGIEGMKNLSKPHITTATFTSLTKINITTDTAVTKNSYFKVKDATGNILVELNCANASCVGAKKVSIDIPSGKSIDFTQQYTVVDEPVKADDSTFTAKPVAMTELYGLTAFNDLYKYNGELGAIYSKEQTVFRVWTPYATAMKVNIYAAGEGGTATSYDMTKSSQNAGVWEYALPGDNNGKYYTYTVINSNVNTRSEVVDPYARSGGRNGERGMILDLDATDPDSWDDQNEPVLDSCTKSVIWEAQLRDITIHESSGVSEENRGKFLGLTETGTVNKYGEPTALDYLKQLGITEVHFQPLFDFASVNESFNKATYNKAGEYNWGYDPLNYNMPEGSYSSDPADGKKRVNEMKQMIMALHNAGIRVVMDVVYNHVSSAPGSNFEKLVPGYYFRKTDTGAFSNGSGCGNETASDHYMFRKFMIDSVKYWTEEYMVDGFRFDLMALHDIDTMNALYDELAAINPDVLVYGEGWTAGTSGLSDGKQCRLANAAKTPKIAYFNDTIRDGLKGSVFSITSTGFVSGAANTDSIIYGGAACNSLPSVKQNINYVACHDNSLLWDKLNASVNDTKDNIKAMNRMAAAAVMTSQGIAFIPAGEEMMRSKPTTKTNDYDNRPNVYKTDSNYYFSDNSYKSPDSVNAIDWDLLHENADMVEFYKQLIAIKKSFTQFQFTDKSDLAKNLIYNDSNIKDGVTIYAIRESSETDEFVVVIFNNNKASKVVSIPEGNYKVYVDGKDANVEGLNKTVKGKSVTVGAVSCMILKGSVFDEVQFNDTQKTYSFTDWTYNVSDLTAA